MKRPFFTLALVWSTAFLGAAPALADQLCAADLNGNGDAANVCPAGPGEEVMSACGCLDDFPEAVVMMQTVRLAGADMTCTSAVP
jgi:hypothetical protein